MSSAGLAIGAAALLAIALPALGGCGDDPEPSATASATSAGTSGTATGPATSSSGAETTYDATEPPTSDEPADPVRRRTRPESLVPVHCPAELSNCSSASGEIIYVERVDPDGDGDAHFVLLSRQSITAPGISVIDVEAGLRPQPLPGVGDWISAAGPVYEGSHGQLQIEAIELRFAPASD